MKTLFKSIDIGQDNLKAPGSELIPALFVPPIWSVWSGRSCLYRLLSEQFLWQCGLNIVGLAACGRHHILSWYCPHATSQTCTLSWSTYCDCTQEQQHWWTSVPQSKSTEPATGQQSPRKSANLAQRGGYLEPNSFVVLWKGPRSSNWEYRVSCVNIFCRIYWEIFLNYPNKCGRRQKVSFLLLYYSLLSMDWSNATWIILGRNKRQNAV